MAASRPAWLHKNEPASGELSPSELNPYVVGGLRELAAIGNDGCAEVGVERVQEPFPWKHEPRSSCHRSYRLSISAHSHHVVRIGGILVVSPPSRIDPIGSYESNLHAWDDRTSACMHGKNHCAIRMFV
jgi:hypothetical protein